MEKTVEKICKLLGKYGIETETDKRNDRPENILRGSWYVQKLVELGYLHCIYIDLVDENCFLAVLDGGRIMSGNNVMIMDAFQVIGDMAESVEVWHFVDKMYELGFEIYTDDGYDTDTCIVCPSYEMFER